MTKKLKLRIVLSAFFLMASSIPAYAGPAIQHVLLISIDGFHALDYLNCVQGGYCPWRRSEGMASII